MVYELAKPCIQIDDARVKVTRWDFSSGAETGWHKHKMDYVIVPLTDGKLTAEFLDGTAIESTLTIGASYAKPAGVDHNVINKNDSPFSFIEIELK